MGDGPDEQGVFRGPLCQYGANVASSKGRQKHMRGVCQSEMTILF